MQRFDRLRRLRQRPAIGYAVALLGIAAAAVLHLNSGEVFRSVPFLIFYPPIALAAVVGGGRPGIVALALATLVANYIALPPVFVFSLDPAGLLGTGLFVLVAGLLLLLICLLNLMADRMWQQAENGRLILDAQPTGVLAVDANGRITLVNASVEQQLGYSREELIDRPVDLLVPMSLREQHVELRQQFMEDPRPRRMGAGRDLNAVAKDGSLLPVEIGLSPVWRQGRFGTLATIVDISERKSLEWHAQILSNEVRHRARNLLTLVQAIAMRKLPREEGRAFVRTLEALARTHDVLGAGQTAPLRAIVEGELAGFPDQCRISGCNILLAPRAAQDFALIVHELAANALKYGALSVPEGRVTVSGREDGEGSFVFRWSEQGGPAVAEPTRRGFGWTILEELAQSFSTRASLEYPEQGVRYELAAQSSRIGKVAELPTAAKGGA